MRILAGLMLAALALAVTGAASAGPRARSALHTGPITVKVPLPSAGRASVELVTLTATAKEGHKLGRLTITSTDDAQLPPGIRAVAWIEEPKKPSHRATYKAYVLINNLTGTSASTAAGWQDMENLRLHVANVINFALSNRASSTLNCVNLNEIGAEAEPNGIGPGLSFTALLEALRPENEQTSNPEAVVDYVIHDECGNQGAEQPETGAS